MTMAIVTLLYDKSVIMRPQSGLNTHVDLGLRDASAGRSLFNRRRSEVVRRSSPQNHFLLISRQHLIQFLWWRRDTKEKDDMNTEYQNQRLTNHDDITVTLL